MHRILLYVGGIVFALFVIMSSPKLTLAAPLGDIFSSQDSLFVRIQERIEYFFAFNIQQKVIVLEKQAERRLTRAENLVKTKDVGQALSLIKSYEILKEKQGDLIGGAPATVLDKAKEQTIKQQARIEDMKEDMPEEAKELIEDGQKTVIKTMMDTIDDSGTKEDKDEATEFAEEIKNVIDPGSNIFAPGTLEVAPGTSEVAPGVQDIKP
ncbi:MAG: hypothetical protein A2804_03355 [Candidatus Pacebacteria bacterium RIFCSPHIGHO2_01_FULL_46_10]|nr:MAG: hypothetical protein A2804_03355 [Candidatus Pacebacteria bacterium RIFCSPHIGHO2_01_FULL_46_10]